MCGVALYKFLMQSFGGCLCGSLSAFPSDHVVYQETVTDHQRVKGSVKARIQGI